MGYLLEQVSDEFLSSMPCSLLLFAWPVSVSLFFQSLAEETTEEIKPYVASGYYLDFTVKKELLQAKIVQLEMVEGISYFPDHTFDDVPDYLRVFGNSIQNLTLSVPHWLHMHAYAIDGGVDIATQYEVASFPGEKVGMIIEDPLASQDEEQVIPEIGYFIVYLPCSVHGSYHGWPIAGDPPNTHTHKTK